MRSLPNAYKQAILNDQKKYYVTARINLADGNTHFNLTNEELWEGSGFSIEEAVSEDGKFTALGSTIISTARLSIKNLNEEYSSYDFTGAVAIVYLGIVGINENPVLIGTYTVDECSFTDGAINLTLLDNMEMLDRPYTAAVTYPATLYTIVNAACQNAGLLFESASSSTPFPHHNLVLDDEFDSDGLTCREVVGMAAAIAGCFVKCTPAGKIKFGWFDYSTLNSWQTAYGNNTTPSQQVLSKMHYITSVFSQDISVDPVNITGVRIVYEKTVDSQRREYTVTAGSEGYVIGIEKNNLLNAYTTAQINSIRDWLGTQLIGMTFRKASVSHSSDPAIESGDVAAVWDRKGRGYPILVTRVNFTAYDLQKTVCGAETPLRNKATRYTWQSKAYQDMIKQLNEERSLRQLAEQELQQAVATAAGMYLTTVTDQQSGSTIYYLHNFRDFDSSPVRIMFADTGIMMTSNGTADHPTWYGLTTSGTMFANLIAAIQIGFDQARGGTLTLGGAGNGNGVLEVYDSSNRKIGILNNTGLELRQRGSSYSVIEDLGNINYATQTITVDTVGGRFTNTLDWASAKGLVLKYIDTINQAYSEGDIKSYFGIIPRSSSVLLPMFTTGTVFEFTPTFASRTDATQGEVTSLQFRNNGFNYNYTRYAEFYDNANISWEWFTVLNDKPFFICTSNGLRYASSLQKEAFLYLSKTSSTVELYSNKGGARLYVKSGKFDQQNADVTVTKDVSITAALTVSAKTTVAGILNITQYGKLDIDNYLTVKDGIFRVQGSYHGDQFIYVRDDGNMRIQIGNPVASYGCAGFDLNPGTSGGYAILIGTPSGLSYNQSTVQMASSSSRRYKHDIAYDLTGDRDFHRLLKLRPAEFIFNDDHPLQYHDMKGEKIPGLIAEDVAEIYPSATIHDPDTGEIESWDERRIIPGMLALIQEQHETIEEQKKQLNRQQMQLNEMQGQINELIELVKAAQDRADSAYRLACI